MTDFGVRQAAFSSTEAKQDDVITALALLHVDVATTILALIDGVETALAVLHTDVGTTVVGWINQLEAYLITSNSVLTATYDLLGDEILTALNLLHTDLGPLTAQTTLTFVADVTFDDDPTTYTAAGEDVSAYRKFLLLVNVAVVNNPATIRVHVQFSDDNVTYYNYMNGPFGSLVYEDSAAPTLESIQGECLADYMRVYVAATGTDGTDKFILTVKAILVR